MARKNTAEAVVSSSQSTQASAALARVAFLDNLRYLMVVLVVLYHAVAAYAIVAPHWAVHDTTLFSADIIREFFDVFMMPVLFFAAGYFALPSLVKNGTGKFLMDKVRRLLVPWALAVFIIIPLALYDQPVKPVRPFWRYWLNYLGSFAIRLRFSQTPVGVTTQAVYWFISLLFAFFLVFALFYLLALRLRGGAAPSIERRMDPRRSVISGLALFGLLSFATYFLLLLWIPDSSWFTLSAFLEFQVTRLVPFAGCFALGVYAQSQAWFSDGKPLGSPALWGAAGAVLAIAYLVFGQPMFADTAGTAHFTAGYLLVFAFLRSALLLSLLAACIALAMRYWNSARSFDRGFSAASYNIYLVHFWIVVVLQTALLQWTSGPVLLKIAVVFLSALSISYAFSRWVLARHARAFTIVVLALFVFCLVVRP